MQRFGKDDARAAAYMTYLAAFYYAHGSWEAAEVCATIQWHVVHGVALQAQSPTALTHDLALSAAARCHAPHTVHPYVKSRA